MATTPKLCGGCLIFGFGCLLITGSRGGATVLGMNLLRSHQVFLSAITTLVILASTVNVAFGWSSKVVPVQPEEWLVGRKINQGIIVGERIVMISDQDCQACHLAKTSLHQNGISFGEIPVNELETELHVSSVPTPTFLLVDTTGRIDKQFSGWPTQTDGQTKLVSELRSEVPVN